MHLDAQNLSLLIAHEGQTSTLSILERGLTFQKNMTGIDYRLLEITEGMELSIRPNEVVVFVRSATPISAGLAQELRQNNRPYIYYIDDDFWALDIKTSLGSYYRSPSTIAAMHELISGASSVITNSAILAKRLSRKSLQVEVVPAFFDFALVDHGPENEPEQPEENSAVRVGFASNHSRAQDLSMIVPTIHRLLREYQNIEIEIIGFAPADTGHLERVTTFPHLNDYEEYVAFQVSRRWSVGLAPLRDTPQNAAKTNNKYREYGAMGIAGVYSDLPPYAEVENGRTGFRVSANPTAWFQAIKDLVDSHDLRDRVVKLAKADVREKYGIQIFANAWTPIFQRTALQGHHDSNLVWVARPAKLKFSSPYTLWYLFRTQNPVKATRTALGILTRKLTRE